MLKKSSVWQRLSMAAMNFLIGMTITVLMAVIVMQLTGRQNRELALHTAEVYSARTERLLDSLFHKTDVLDAILVENGGQMDDKTFQRLSATLDDGIGIRAVQCLPDGIVRFCYPIEGNDDVIGTGVFDDPQRRADAMLALETRSIALSGPYQLYQGGLGLVARNPVFLTDEEGNEIFWGFTVIILDLPEALDPIVLSELTKDGYAYRLYCVVDTGEEMTIAESGTVLESEGIDYTIHVPNHVWTLSIIPEKGWNEWGLVAAIFMTGSLISLLMSVVIFQWQERTRVLRRIAVTDELTGLYNRRYLNETIDKWCRRGGEPFTLFYMDLDCFKKINDTLGHHWGDVVLIEAAGRIAAVLGPGILTARVGGDEFVAAETDSAGVYQATVERIHHMFHEPFLLEDRQLMVGVSIGCVRFPEDGEDYETLMHKADERMYKEKQNRHI